MRRGISYPKMQGTGSLVGPVGLQGPSSGAAAPLGCLSVHPLTTGWGVLGLRPQPLWSLVSGGRLLS